MMRIDDVTRRTFLVAGGAAVTGALVGCGGGGVLPLDAAPVEGDTGVPAPTGTALDAGSPEAVDEARENDPIVAYLTRHDFDRWRGESFDVTNAQGQNATIELVDVIDLSHTVNEETRIRGLREPFAVRFHGPLDVELAQGQYDVRHPDMGDVTLFVVFGGTTELDEERPSNGDRRIYDVTFS